MASSTTRSLRALDRSDEQPHDVHLILIKGIGTRPVDNWDLLSPPWRHFLASTESPVKLFAFDYDMALNDNFSFELLLEQGHVLLQQLAKHQTDMKTLHPLAFMCHSLGGFILKHALCIANAQSHQFPTLLYSITGIVFLGSPHCAAHADKLTRTASWILRSIPSSISKKAHAQISESARFLTDISRLFNDVQLRIEMLSLFEMQESKVKVGLILGKGLFHSTKPMILVDRESTVIGAPLEQSFGLAGTHAELCALRQTDGKPDVRLQKWMAHIFGKSSRDAVTNRLSSLRPSSSPASLTSMSSYDAARIALRSQVLIDGPELQNTTSIHTTYGSSGKRDWEIAPILRNISKAQRMAQLPCFMIDTQVRNKDFFGRQALLEQLDTHLLPSTTASFSSQPSKQRHVVLCGMGGIGKTSVALEFFFSRLEKFDAVFWIRANEPGKLEDDFAKIALCLGLEDASEASNPVVSRDLAKNWLQMPRRTLDPENDLMAQADANWLLIFDNADTPELLLDYWPLCSSGSILVTSRDPLSKTTPSIASIGINVSPFDDNEGALLLRHLSRVTEQAEVSVEISRRLGGLPLAISQMAAIIRHQYLSFSDFLDRYDNDRDRKELHSYQVGDQQQGARGNAATIWAVEQLSESARTMLEICSVLDSDCIQERLFLFDNLPFTVGTLAGYSKSGFAYSTARAELIRSSLITRNNETREIWIHRVLQDSVQSKMSSDRMLDIFVAAVSLVRAALTKTSQHQRHNTGLLRNREGFIPHVLVLKGIYEKLYRRRNLQGAVPLAHILNEAGLLQHGRGQSLMSKPQLKLALEICNTNPSEELVALRDDVLHNLGAVEKSTNNVTMSLEYTTRRLDYRLQALKDGEQPDVRVASAYNEHGLSCMLNGRPEQAVEHFLTSIRYYKELEDYQLAMDNNPRMNLGFAYWATAQLDKGLEYLEQLLEDRVIRFGPHDSESFRTGRVLHGIGNIRFDQGRLDDAREWHQRALHHHQQNIGNNHPFTADVCYRVAQDCLVGGDTDSARKLIEQALKVYRLDSAHMPELARTTFLKAKLLMKLGDEDAAIVAFKDASAMRSRLPGVPKRTDAELVDKDFDQLVIFTSR